MIRPIVDSGKSGFARITLYSLTLLILSTACSTTGNVAYQWAQKVDSGEYGWVDFNTGETENLDAYPQERIDFLKGNLYPEYSQRCFEQLRDYGGDVPVEIQFLIGTDGRPQQFAAVSPRASICARNIIESLSTFSFTGAQRNGQSVPTIGKYTVDLAGRSGGYGN